MHVILRQIICVLFALFAPHPAEAKKLALVVGIGDYEHLPKLVNPTIDAAGVVEALRDLGFEVLPNADNLSRRDVNRRIADLEARIQPGDTVFFYFSGHGVAIGGQNLLVAKDMPEVRDGDESIVAEEGISVDGIIGRIQRRGAGVTLAVIDACRDNPFEQAGRKNIGQSKGLARIDAPQGSFVLFAAGTGQKALDRLNSGDNEPYSVFTRKLLPLLRTPGLTHNRIAKLVQEQVSDLAATVRHPQLPAFYDQIKGEIVLRDGQSSAAVAAPATVPQVTATAPVPQKQSIPAQKRENSGSFTSGFLEPEAQPAPKASGLRAGGNGFVSAIVSTNLGRAEAIKRLAELQQKYPELLRARPAEVQEVNLGEGKGVWYRAVVGPPGSREAAGQLCAQLVAVGHKGCFATTY